MYQLFAFIGFWSTFAFVFKLIRTAAASPQVSEPLPAPTKPTWDRNYFGK